MIPAASTTFTVNVLDPPAPGLLLSPDSLAASYAEGDSQTQAIKLATQPQADVIVAVTSDDSTVLEVTGSPLTFTSANWAMSQEVVFRAVRNRILDSAPRQATVTHVVTSSVGDYDTLGPFTQAVGVTNTDAPQFGFAGGAFAQLPESGMITVSVELVTGAEAPVALAVWSADKIRATLSASTVTVTVQAAGDSRLVTVFGVDNKIDEDPDDFATGFATYELRVSVLDGPTPFKEETFRSRPGNIVDDDTASLELNPPTLQDLAEGESVTMSVMLGSQPTAAVVVGVGVSDPSELSLSHLSLGFTTANWNVPQPVILTGKTDSVVDGSKPVTLTYTFIFGDALYGALANVTQELDVTDADNAGFMLTPDTLPEINEDGGTATVTLRLLTAAEGGVTLAFTSLDTAVATLSSTPLRATLTTTGHRATVTLGTVDNSAASGDQTYALKVSVMSGPVGYAGLELTVTGTALDDDSPNLVLDQSSLPPLAEADTSQVMVNLAIQPTGGVTVAVSSSDTGELSVSPAELVFTDSDWNTAQPVMLSGVADNLVDGSQTVTVTYAVSSSDSGYGGLAARTQSQEVTDSDMGGLALEPAALPPLSEPDGVATVSLRLTKSSSSPVTLAVWSSDRSVATLSSAMVTLTLMSELDRGAVVLGVVDNTTTGDRRYDLRVSVVRGVGGYADLMLTVPGMVIDDDAAGIRFIPAALPRIDEGGSLTVSVALGATPTEPVTLAVSSRNPLVATLTAAIVNIILDESRLSAPVIVSGVPNALLADQPYELTVSATSDDTNYDGLFASASGIVVSDDSVLVASPAELGDIPKEDGSVTVELRLDADPMSVVTVNIGNAAPTGATLLGASQTPTFMMDDLADRVTVTLVAVNDEGVYPREFGLLVTVTTGNAPDAGFNTVLTLRGMVIEPGVGSETTAILQIAVADLAAAGLVIDLVSDNVNRGASDGPRAQIGGRSVTGLSASVGMSPPRPPDPWNDSDPWAEPDDAQWQDVMGLLPDSGFVLPLSSGASPGAGTRTEMWGGARYSDLSGEPAVGGVRHSYDGDAVAVQVGVTRRYASGTSAGFSVGHSWVDLEVSAVGDDEVVKARRRLVSVHPYVSLTPFPDTRLLLLAGLGDGTFSTVGGEDRDASMRMTAARLERDWQMGGFDLSGKLGFLSVESELKAEAADAAALRGGSFQSRVELEFSKSYSPAAGMTVRPYGSVGYLHESGTVDTDGGVELGAGLRGAWIAGLDADISARYQLDGAKRSERKLKGHMSFDTGLDGRGLLLDASQEHSLSEEADGSASLASEYTVRLGHGWGRTLWRRHGVLGAYVSTVEGSGGDGFHGPRLGLSFEAMSLELVAEQGFGEGRIHLNYVSNF